MKRLLLMAVILVLGGPGSTPAEPQSPGRGVRTVILVRHGAYDRSDRVEDTIGNGLNALGREQARLVAQRLANLPLPMTSLVTSDFTRARQTGEEIGRALRMTPVQDSLIHECTPPSERTESTRDRAAADLAACDSSLNVAWVKYFTPSPEADARDVLVCHGNVIRWFVAKALGVDTRRWLEMEIANASLTMIAVRADGTTRLLQFSDVGHVAPPKQTWSGRGPGWGRPPGR